MIDTIRFDARSTDGAEVGRAIDDHGYAIIENMLGTEDLCSLRTELEPQLATQATGETDFLGARTKRLNNLFMRAPTTRKMALHPILLGAADHTLLPWCARYQISYTGTMHLMPGETAQALHRDAFFYPFRNPGPVTQQGSLWAVTDFSSENGATRIVPGSHLWEEERQPRAEEVIPAEMPAGSAIIYAHNLIHGGGANTTGEPRTAVAINFTLGCCASRKTSFLHCLPRRRGNCPSNSRGLSATISARPSWGRSTARTRTTSSRSPAAILVRATIPNSTAPTGNASTGCGPKRCRLRLESCPRSEAAQNDDPAVVTSSRFRETRFPRSSSMPLPNKWRTPAIEFHRIRQPTTPTMGRPGGSCR